MNIKKIMLGVVLLLLIAIVFALGRLGIATPVNSVVDSASTQVKTVLEKKSAESAPSIQNNTAPKTTNPTNSTTQTEKSSAPATTPTLTAGQSQMLKSFGIDPNTVTITPTMMACAEGKVGTARFAEIKNGATPTMFEGAKLIACYK